MTRCNSCSSLFNALEHLSENPTKKPSKQSKSLPPANITRQRNVNWNIAIGFSLILFMLQVYFFEGYHLTQNNTLRPWLVKVCNITNCALPLYKNLNELTISQGSFQTINKSQSIFKAAFSNDSRFEQRYPSIKLTLQNFTGDDFAQSIFLPADYIFEKPYIMSPGAWSQITLVIATPSTKIGGYRFEFI
jgi:hypothetical protein